MRCNEFRLRLRPDTVHSFDVQTKKDAVPGSRDVSGVLYLVDDFVGMLLLGQHQQDFLFRFQSQIEQFLVLMHAGSAAGYDRAAVSVFASRAFEDAVDHSFVDYGYDCLVAHLYIHSFSWLLKLR